LRELPQRQRAPRGIADKYLPPEGAYVMKQDDFSNTDAARGIIQIRLGRNLYDRLESIARKRDERVADVASDMIEDAVMDAEQRR